MRIEVTAQDCERGRQCDSLWCPVAEAVRRAVGGRDAFVAVNVDYVLIGLGGPLTRVVELPFDVGERIAAFDRTGRMEPFGFDLAYDPDVSLADDGPSPE